VTAMQEAFGAVGFAREDSNRRGSITILSSLNRPAHRRISPISPRWSCRRTREFVSGVPVALRRCKSGTIERASIENSETGRLLEPLLLGL
jgi:hypothetical protein